MKTFLIKIFVLFAISFFSISCKENTEITPEITLAKEEISFETTAGSTTLAIKTNLAWSAGSSADWCTISPSSGEAGTKQLTIAVSANTTDGVRNATISIKAGELTKNIKITQTLQKLKLDKSSVNFDSNGGDFTVSIQATESYTTTFPEWITLKSTAADKSSQIFTVAYQGLTSNRTGKIIYTSGILKDSVTVIQSGATLYIAPDASGMTNDAMTLASKMGLGWNLGNSLEACTSDILANETSWGNPKTTKTLINAVKAAGFNTVRIPCAWSGYIEDQNTYRIKSEWLARVKEVVNYCIDNNMYVILNIHWDGGWLENNPTYAKQTEVNKKQKALWEQIAIYFRNYDEHLLFAGTNEVHADYGTPKAENLEVQSSFNKTFVDAVRSTGGRNSWRNLIVQSYNTNISLAIQYLTLPQDIHANRQMAEVHFYDPWEFCIREDDSVFLWGKNFTGSGTVNWGQETYVDQTFADLKSHFVEKGIPVIIGEYGAMLRLNLTGTNLQNHILARNYYLNYVTKKAVENSLVPVYWDNGGTGNDGMGLFNRNDGSIAHSDALEAIISAAK